MPELLYWASKTHSIGNPCLMGFRVQSVRLKGLRVSSLGLKGLKDLGV